MHPEDPPSKEDYMPLDEEELELCSGSGSKQHAALLPGSLGEQFPGSTKCPYCRQAVPFKPGQYNPRTRFGELVQHHRPEFTSSERESIQRLFFPDPWGDKLT